MIDWTQKPNGFTDDLALNEVLIISTTHNEVAGAPQNPLRGFSSLDNEDYRSFFARTQRFRLSLQARVQAWPSICIDICFARPPPPPESHHSQAEQERPCSRPADAQHTNVTHFDRVAEWLEPSSAEKKLLLP